jgi:glutathione S-transferase
MRLIGRYSSPYTRRVAITLKLYGLSFEHQGTIPFAEGKSDLRRVNPLGRVPVLVTPNDENLCESHVIIDYLDSLVADDVRLTPAEGPDRFRILNYTAIAGGATDKLVSTLYEHHFRKQDKIDKDWVRMCEQQVIDGFSWLDAELDGDWFVADRLSQADVTTATYWMFGCQRRPSFFQRMNCPRLQSLAKRLAELDAFRETRHQGDALPKGIAPDVR